MRGNLQQQSDAYVAQLLEEVRASGNVSLTHLLERGDVFTTGYTRSPLPQLSGRELSDAEKGFCRIPLMAHQKT